MANSVDPNSVCSSLSVRTFALKYRMFEVRFKDSKYMVFEWLIVLTLTPFALVFLSEHLHLNTACSKFVSKIRICLIWIYNVDIPKRKLASRHTTLEQRWFNADVELTLNRRCFNVECPLSIHLSHRSTYGLFLTSRKYAYNSDPLKPHFQ